MVGCVPWKRSPNKRPLQGRHARGPPSMTSDGAHNLDSQQVEIPGGIAGIRERLAAMGHGMNAPEPKTPEGQPGPGPDQVPDPGPETDTVQGNGFVIQADVTTEDLASRQPSKPKRTPSRSKSKPSVDSGLNPHNSAGVLPPMSSSSRKQEQPGPAIILGGPGALMSNGNKNKPPTVLQSQPVGRTGSSQSERSNRSPKPKKPLVDDPNDKRTEAEKLLDLFAEPGHDDSDSEEAAERVSSIFGGTPSQSVGDIIPSKPVIKEKPIPFGHSHIQPEPKVHKPAVSHVGHNPPENPPKQEGLEALRAESASSRQAIIDDLMKKGLLKPDGAAIEQISKPPIISNGNGQQGTGGSRVPVHENAVPGHEDEMLKEQEEMMRMMKNSPNVVILGPPEDHKQKQWRAPRNSAIEGTDSNPQDNTSPNRQEHSSSRRDQSTLSGALGPSMNLSPSVEDSTLPALSVSDIGEVLWKPSAAEKEMSPESEAPPEPIRLPSHKSLPGARLKLPDTHVMLVPQETSGPRQMEQSARPNNTAAGDWEIQPATLPNGFNSAEMTPPSFLQLQLKALRKMQNFLDERSGKSTPRTMSRPGSNNISRAGSTHSNSGVSDSRQSRPDWSASQGSQRSRVPATIGSPGSREKSTSDAPVDWNHVHTSLSSDIRSQRNRLSKLQGQNQNDASHSRREGQKPVPTSTPGAVERAPVAAATYHHTNVHHSSSQHIKAPATQSAGDRLKSDLRAIIRDGQPPARLNNMQSSDPLKDAGNPNGEQKKISPVTEAELNKFLSDHPPVENALHRVPSISDSEVDTLSQSSLQDSGGASPRVSPTQLSSLSGGSGGNKRDASPPKSSKRPSSKDNRGPSSHNRAPTSDRGPTGANGYQGPPERSASGNISIAGLMADFKRRNPRGTFHEWISELTPDMISRVITNSKQGTGVWRQLWEQIKIESEPHLNGDRPAPTSTAAAGRPSTPTRGSLSAVHRPATPTDRPSAHVRSQSPSGVRGASPGPAQLRSGSQGLVNVRSTSPAPAPQVPARSPVVGSQGHPGPSFPASQLAYKPEGYTAGSRQGSRAPSPQDLGSRMRGDNSSFISNYNLPGPAFKPSAPGQTSPPTRNSSYKFWEVGSQGGLSQPMNSHMSSSRSPAGTHFNPGEIVSRIAGPPPVADRFSPAAQVPSAPRLLGPSAPQPRQPLSPSAPQPLGASYPSFTGTDHVGTEPLSP